MSNRTSAAVRVACGLHSILACAAVMPAYAQSSETPEEIGGLTEIVVTATRSSANLQDVGISLSAFSSDDLAQRGVRDSTDLALLTPGLQFADPGGSPIAGLISIRGVSQNDFAGHIEPANAYYIDEVYQPSNATSVQRLYDVERVEVLKGPQGTLFGRNATGGLLHVITRQPTQSLDGFAELTVGSFDQLGFEGAVGGPLSDTVSARAAVLYNRNDGYFKNAIGPDYANDDTVAGRVQVKIEPSDQLDISLFADYYEIRPIYTGASMITGAAPDADGLGVQLPPGSPTGFGYVDADGDPYTGALDYPGQLERRTWSTGAKVQYQFDTLTFASITSYQKLESTYDSDNDFSPYPIGIFQQNADATHLTQELRLIDADGAFRWTAGVYYLAIDGDYFQGFNLPAFASYPRASYSVDTRSASAFAQSEYDISDSVRLTTGVRVTRDEKTYNYTEVCEGALCPLFIQPGTLAANGTTSDKHAETGTSGRVQLDWSATDDLLLYSSVSLGYKAFNYNAGFVGQAPLSMFRFKGESLLAYEIGEKFQFMNNRARLNGAVFYYDYDDYQAFDQRGFNFTLFNTTASMYGADAELSVSAGDGYLFSVGGAYLRTKVDDVPIGNRRVSREAPQSPRYTSNLSASKDTHFQFGGLNVNVTASYGDDFYAQLTNAPVTRIPASWLVNARVTLSLMDDRLSVAVFANNLLDEERETFAFDVSGAPLGGTYTTYGEPRWYGVQTRIKF